MRFDHRTLDPRAKLAFTVAVSALAVALSRIDALVALGALTTLVVVAGRGLTVRTWIGLLAPFRWLVPLILVLNAFFYGGGALLWSLDSVGVPLRLTTGGIEASLVIAGRLLVLAAVAAWFATTTGAEAFEAALTRVGVPWTLAFVISLTLRLAPELRARYHTIEEAQRSRGLEYDGGPLARARARIPVFMPFFVAVIRYGYELGEALEIRDFGRAGRRTSQVTLSFGRTDALFVGVVVVVIGGFAIAFG